MPTALWAKGRVKRANLTLQERLVKEMLPENITCIDAANALGSKRSSAT